MHDQAQPHTASPLASSAPRMSTADIAALLGCTRQHVTSRVTKRVDFPRPYINVSRRMRYWRTVDVMAWLKRGAQ
ncbi:hypothetical protein N5J07_07630 [Comamonas aquatica]|uniref:helix-turn-helix transcriptional regulator n=1 Tax=Comamonas aquatica TaxID=225991 RepID=UPI002449C4CC|nr:hypothetical protein [Comamonas aquatica]MDH1379327.1 hypothetical protein [Comamonas aquatica]MDH1639185.1 hypothetical protein [Comamonas aquatica]